MRAEPYQFSFDDEFQTMNSVIFDEKTRHTQDKTRIVLLVKNLRLRRVLSFFERVFMADDVFCANFCLRRNLIKMSRVFLERKNAKISICELTGRL